MKYLYCSLLILLVVHANAYDRDSLREWLETDPEFAKQAEEHMKKRPAKYGQASGVTGFDCPNKVSASVPTSVHSLRPGDIKVVAALGDSITAGFGAGANDLLEMLLEYRGMTFAIGGDDDLEHRVTIPNVIRKFNPTVFGYSKGVGDVAAWHTSYLNTAEPGKRTDDLERQAHELVAMMRNHPENIDIINDWKLLTIFIGGNDICHACHSPVKKFASENGGDTKAKPSIDELYTRHCQSYVSHFAFVEISR